LSSQLPNQRKIDQAGGIVFRTDGGQPRILLVRAKKDPQKWVFPKGHIEAGESASQAALREVREEAGVDGELLGPIGPPLEFMSGGEPVRVQYFLIRMTSDMPSPEGREKRWLSAREAAKHLDFRRARELVRAAAQEIKRR
jgi:8-oxo-dGTP pyrophosphatase MutT (NUDIX family)